MPDNTPTPPPTGGTPLIAVDPKPQAMTHEQLAAHALAAHTRASGTTPAGLRADHATWVGGLLSRTRSTLTGIAGVNQHGSAGADAVAETEAQNQQAVAGVDPTVPQFRR